MEGSDSHSNSEGKDPVDELPTEKQESEEVPAGTTDVSDVQNSETTNTEGGSPSTNVVETEPITKDDSQLPAATASIIDSVDEGFDTRVTSSVSILRSDPWPSMEVSATLPRNARIVFSSNDTEVSIDSKQCDKNDSELSPNPGEVNVSCKGVDQRICSEESQVPSNSADANITDAIFSEKKNVSQEIDILPKKSEDQEVKSNISSDPEKSANRSDSPTFLSKVQSMKAFFDGNDTASSGNAKPPAPGNASCKRTIDEKVRMENVQSSNQDSIKSSQNYSGQTAALPEDKSQSSTSALTDELNKEVESRNHNSDASKEPKSVKVEIIVSCSDENKESCIAQSATQSTDLKQSQESPTNLKKNEWSLVLPVIKITEASDVEEEIEDSEELVPSEKEIEVREELGSPAKEIPVREELGSPAKEITVPEELGSPAKEITVPEELGAPEKEITVPEELGSPEKEITVPEELGSSAKEITVPEELGSPAKEITVPEELGAPAKEITVPEELGSPAKEITVSEELGSAAKETPVSEELGSAAKETPVSEELGSAEKETPVSEELGSAAKEIPVSEELGSLAKEIKVSVDLEMGKKVGTGVKFEKVGNAAEVMEDSRPKTDENLTGENANEAKPEEVKEIASNTETNGSNSFTSVPLTDGSEFADQTEQIEEPKAVFYISSSEIEPGRLERESGYTNLAFQNSEETSEWRSLEISLRPEINRSGPSECLGSASLHGGIIMFSIFVAFVGFAIYNLAQQGRVPYIYETIGLSTSAIAGGIALLSSLYIGVQWCCRSLPNARYLPIEDNEIEPLIDRASYLRYHSIETGYAEMERAHRQHEHRTSNLTLDERMRIYQDQPSTSALPDATQKLKTEVTGLLETLADVISKKKLEDSSDDFGGEEMETVLGSEPVSSESSVYASAELPPNLKDEPEEQNRSPKKD